MNIIDTQIVEYGSPLQLESVELRYKVLREPLGMVYTPEQLTAERDEIHLVALQNGKVVGVVVLKEISKAILKMRQVAVEPSLQRSGIGRKMVDSSEHLAREKGYSVIELHARETAVDFYLSMNYEIEGDLFYEVGIPHFKMIKNL